LITRWNSAVVERRSSWQLRQGQTYLPLSHLSTTSYLPLSRRGNSPRFLLNIYTPHGPSAFMNLGNLFLASPLPAMERTPRTVFVGRYRFDRYCLLSFRILTSILPGRTTLDRPPPNSRRRPL
jgi:hypothetical protein